MTILPKLFAALTGILFAISGMSAATEPSDSTFKFDCSAPGPELFDTGLGFEMYVPQGFQSVLLGDERQLIYSVKLEDGNGVEYERDWVVVWSESADLLEQLKVVKPLHIAHRLGPRIKLAFVSPTAEVESTTLAVTNGDTALFVRSFSELDVQSVISCFVR